MSAAFAFKPLSPLFGIETFDVDLARPLSDAQFKDIERAFYAGQVLALRGQRITAAQFVEFARRLGPPQPHVDRKSTRLNSSHQ